MPVSYRYAGAAAYTVPPEGISPTDTAQLSFVAQSSGSYYLARARRGHLMSGQAMATVREDQFMPHDLPGRR